MTTGAGAVSKARGGWCGGGHVNGVGRLERHGTMAGATALTTAVRFCAVRFCEGGGFGEDVGAVEKRERKTAKSQVYWLLLAHPDRVRWGYVLGVAIPGTYYPSYICYPLVMTLILLSYSFIFIFFPLSLSLFYCLFISYLFKIIIKRKYHLCKYYLHSSLNSLARISRSSI
jgi:hypothetical protein